MLVAATICLLVILAAFSLRKLQSKKQIPTFNDAVLITGCDSGIGYSLACHCSLQLGVSVFAACLNVRSNGALRLLELRNMHVVQMDVCNPDSVKTAATAVTKILSENKYLALKALVNNAGVMVFGEFAWLTEDIIEQQIGVNLVGAMRVTKTFLPMIVKNKARIINICSHCSLEALPGLSVYAASKSALLAWSDALRIEMKKFGVPVVSFIPGSFFLCTNILANQKHYSEEMRRNMSLDDWALYEKYFIEYNSYLCGFEVQKPKQIDDKFLYKLFDEALLRIIPRSRYSHAPPRYIFYHTLFKITPTWIRDQLVIRFMNMPKWKN